MARPCTTCQHLHRSAIDRRLAAGEPTKRIARDYGLSPVSLGRHRVNCVGLTAPVSAITKDASRGTVALASLPSKEEIAGGYDSIRERADAIVQQAEGAGSLAVALIGLREMRSTLDSVARLSGHDKPASPEVSVTVDVAAIVDSLIAAIGPKPSRHQIVELERVADGDA
ncbi:MAG: hypothetical protein GY788_30590 [bacterium]|nr:hypothetical protein [bacterium]